MARSVSARKPGRPPKAGPDEPAVREQILVKAAELFSTIGYAGTSISMLAKEVGISPGALYWYFGSKEELLYTLLKDGLDRYEEDIANAVGDAQGPAERLRLLTVGHVRAILQDPEVGRIVGFTANQLSHSLTASRWRSLHARQRKVIAQWRDVIQDGVRAGLFDVQDPTLAALAIIDMCEGTRGWFDPSGPLSAEDVAEQYSGFALGLVRGRARTRRRPATKR